MANDFKKYPYQDYNAFNLDWLLKKIQYLEEHSGGGEIAEEALRKAEQALIAAANAYSLANTANTKADNAQADAAAAVNTADAASSTASTASTAAGAAQTRADNAYTLADTANTAAGAAQTRADNAYTLADTANTAAGAAQTRADNAYTLADSANTAINNLRSNGTWTPTMPRANISSASGKWYVIGDICFLSAKISFSSSQTDRGDLYIEESSLPSAALGKAISGAGAGSLNYVAACTDFNNNLWLSRGNRVKATDISLAGSTVLFTLTAVPK